MYNFVWSRDSVSESLDKTIEKGYNAYIEKYKSNPTEISCSVKDCQEEKIFKNIIVKPEKHVQSGNVWFTGKYFETFKMGQIIDDDKD